MDAAPARSTPRSPSLHCFVVPTHGRSPYLAECLASLQAQTCPTPIIISTSSPFEGLGELARQHGATLVQRVGRSGIGADWNAALAAATSEWITIAHQDDVYSPDYTAEMLRAVTAFPDVLLGVSLGAELRSGVRSAYTPLMVVKRLLTEIAFLGRTRIAGRGAKRRLLSFGNPVICPSVMLNLGRMPDFRFQEDLRSNLDWLAWLTLADTPGAFVLVRELLVSQRTHLGGETTSAIGAGIRHAEDVLMFSRIWPDPVARILAGAYRVSYLNRWSIR